MRRKLCCLLLVLTTVALVGCNAGITMTLDPPAAPTAGATVTLETPAAPTPGKTAASGATAAPTEAERLVEQAILEIPLSGPAASSNAEFSGMAWYGENLILMPQYPDRFESEADGALFALAKRDILDYLSQVEQGNTASPLTPQAIPLTAPGLPGKVPGFEGFEAIAFSGDQVFLTIEARAGGKYQGYLIAGTIAPDLSEVRLDPSTLAPIQAQADLSNMSDEAIVISGERLYTFYEANGPAVNPNPVAHSFGFDLQPLESVPFPNIEYRITDAAPPDETGIFWAINYFFPGDEAKLKPGPDPLAAQYGEGPTHQASQAVERLVRLQFTPGGITLVEGAPVQLVLLPGDEARNWEGLAVLEGRGFLLVTDKFPETILAFVAYESGE